MNAPPLPDEVERFRELVSRRLGLQFEDAKRGFLTDVLRRRWEINGHADKSYLERLDVAPPREELRALAQELTVPETYFFRNIDQFDAFKNVALPDRVRARADTKRLRILSAGCASGEEPYSIAILMRETAIDPSWNVSLLAVDVNPAMLERAARGRYTSWALRETPPEIQQRWFRQDEREIVLDGDIRNAVRFEERNLAADDAGLWAPSAYDTIFCRNVIMYFTPRNAQALMERIARSLAPGGYLFLGHAETLRGLSQDFHLCHTHRTFYYRRKQENEYVSVQPAIESIPPAITSWTFATLVESDDSWVETIRRAADRVQMLTEAPSVARAAAPAHWDLGLAIDLLQKERFEEALALVQAFPPESARDPDVLLLRAVLLVHSGRLVEAEDTCKRLLAIDEMNAGGHYVLALCGEAAGDRQAAANHDQVAVYLDPVFAMPHLHLGLLARKAGDRGSARRELGEALALLQREEASRLLLFGGGFNRETLLALCRGELKACGDEP